MKKIILVVALVIGMITTTFGQSVGNIKIENITVKSILVGGTGNKVYFDIGQEKLNDNEMINISGRKKKFTSVLSAVNFMYDYGYEIHFYRTNTVGINIVHSYILRKKV